MEGKGIRLPAGWRTTLFALGSVVAVVLHPELATETSWQAMTVWVLLSLMVFLIDATGFAAAQRSNAGPFVAVKGKDPKNN